MIRWLRLVQQMSCPPHSFVGPGLENHHESANSLTADDAVKSQKQPNSSIEVPVLQQLRTHPQRDSLSADAA